MANLTEEEIWDQGIYQKEISDAVVAGAQGVANKAEKSLANRTVYLKSKQEKLKDKIYSVIEDAGISPDENVATQLLEALNFKNKRDFLLIKNTGYRLDPDAYTEVLLSSSDIESHEGERLEIDSSGRIKFKEKGIYHINGTVYQESLNHAMTETSAVHFVSLNDSVDSLRSNVVRGDCRDIDNGENLCEFNFSGNIPMAKNELGSLRSNRVAVNGAQNQNDHLFSIYLMITYMG